MADDYNYQSAGFDGFLSRSVESVPQLTLDSAGPDSTAIRFDSSQLSGFIGSALKTPDVSINGTDGLIVTNGKLNAYDDSGVQMIYNGSPYQKIFIGIFSYDITVLGSLGYVIANFKHGLPHAPQVTATVRTATQGVLTPLIWRPLPFLFHSNVSYFGVGNNSSASLVIEYVDDVLISCRIDIFDALGLSFMGANKDLKIVFYCTVNPFV